MSGDLMDRTRSHSPEVTICGLPARTCAQLGLCMGYIRYRLWQWRKAEWFGPMRNDEIGIGIRPILLPTKRHRERRTI